MGADWEIARGTGNALLSCVVHDRGRILLWYRRRTVGAICGLRMRTELGRRLAVVLVGRSCSLVVVTSVRMPSVYDSVLWMPQTEGDLLADMS